MDSLSVLKPNKVLYNKLLAVFDKSNAKPGADSGDAANEGNASGSLSDNSDNSVGGPGPDGIKFNPPAFNDAPDPSQSSNIDSLVQMFLNHLLKPKEWANQTTVGMQGELGDTERF